MSQELNRLLHGPDDAEQPPQGFLVTYRVTANDPGRVLDRVRSVLQPVLEASPELNPDDRGYWLRRLPPWFVEACDRADEPTPQTEWVKMSPAEQAALVEDEVWALEEWLYWFTDDNRAWFWWDASVENDRHLRIVLLLRDEPAAVESFYWLLRAAGAENIEELAEGA